MRDEKMQYSNASTKSLKFLYIFNTLLYDFMLNENILV
jgi:hypothetical protein